jgi:tetratricopeptide (TPR) repeat protein
VSLGIAYFYYERNLSKAEDEFQRALALNPSYALAHSWYALNLGAGGRDEEALDHVRHAQGLDPLSLQINTVAGRIFYFLRQYDRSIDAYRKVIDLDPRYARVHTRLGITYAVMGAFEDAIKEFEESTRLSPLDPHLAGYLGHVHALTGDIRKARRLLRELIRDPQAVFSAALIWMGLGKRDQALECLAKAHEIHCSEMVYAKAEPLLDSLRSDPRFGTLINSMRLS